MLVKVYHPEGEPNSASLTPKDLEELYEAARQERMLEIIGREADSVSWTDFLDVVRLSQLFFAGYRPGDGKPLGFAYLSHPEGDTARVHFAMFRAGRADRLELGRRALEICFAHPWACLVGLIPVTFAGAVQYARDLGGREMGRIPGACWMARLGRSVAGAQFLFFPPGACRTGPTVQRPHL